MKQYIRRKHIIIIGIVSLLASGIILSSNWSYFIRNNDSNNTALTSYQISPNNFNTKYSNETDNIIFQINVLKSAINKNNFMYQNYNKVFKHNISYVQKQRNSMNSKINIANSSIKHEIDILSNMKKIIHNHPYNYLKFFQDKNYTLPEIVSQNNKNINNSLSNIETYTSKINNSNTSISKISYQSEEAAIGIGAITSLISGSNKLIFSKVNFNYNNIFYFSKYSNNLTTLNQFISTHKPSIAQNSAKTNQFIKNNDSNSNNSSSNNLTFSFTQNTIIDYIKNKPYVVAAPLAGLATIGIIGAVVGVVIYKYKKMISNVVRSKDVNNNAQLPIQDANDITPEIANTTPSGFVDNTAKIINESPENVRTVAEQSKVIKPIVEEDRVNSKIIDNVPFQPKSILVKRGVGINKTAGTNSSTKKRRVMFAEDTLPVSPSDNEESVEAHEADDFPSYVSEESENIPTLKNLELRNIISNSHFYNTLKTRRKKQVFVSYSDFSTQVRNYLYLKKTKARSENMGVTRESIKGYIDFMFYKGLESAGLTDKNISASNSAIQITDAKSSSVGYVEGIESTTNGWFEMPKFQEVLRSREITHEEHAFLTEQLDKLYAVIDVFAFSESQPEFYSSIKNSTVVSRYSNENKLVGNEIINDLREVLIAITYHVEALEQLDISPTAEGMQMENYFNHFEETHLLKENFGSISHLGVTNENIVDAINRTVEGVR